MFDDQVNCYGSSTEPEADQGFAESKTFIHKRGSKAREINITQPNTWHKSSQSEKGCLSHINTVQSRARQTQKLSKGCLYNYLTINLVYGKSATE